RPGHPRRAGHLAPARVHALGAALRPAGRPRPGRRPAGAGLGSRAGRAVRAAIRSARARRLVPRPRARPERRGATRRGARQPARPLRSAQGRAGGRHRHPGRRARAHRRGATPLGEPALRDGAHLRADAPAVGGVTLRGWANAVHGLEFLDPRHIVPGVDGALLAGGSAYGLEAVWGVMRFLEGRGIGFRAGPTVVPHVAAAILFDLNVGDMRARPTREMGYAAAASATPAAPGEGSVGAGTGATVGKLHRIERAMRGGIGSASTRAEGAVVGALVAVN